MAVNLGYPVGVCCVEGFVLFGAEKMEGGTWQGDASTPLIDKKVFCEISWPSRSKSFANLGHSLQCFSMKFTINSKLPKRRPDCKMLLRTLVSRGH